MLGKLVVYIFLKENTQIRVVYIQFLSAQKSSGRYMELLSPEIKWFLPVMTRISKAAGNV
jgi:hypothetical protein